jgi:hypothetical protein
MKAIKGSLCISMLWMMVMMGLLLPASVVCASGISLSVGQTVYVPLYNAVRIGAQGSPFPLASTLCIRNADTVHSLTVLAVDYHGSDGKPLRRFLGAPMQLAPLAATDFFIKSTDMSGGLYPSFIVRWKSAAEVSEPVIEAVIVGDRSGQGISFISKGRIIRDDSGEADRDR